MKKQDLRIKMKNNRANLSKEDVEVKSNIICERFAETDLYKKSQFIAVYFAFKNEVDLEKLIKRAISDRKRVCVPVTEVKTGEIYLAEISGEDILKNGAFGIKEPENKKTVNLKSVDLMLVPGLAFDFSGGRVGWGKGFYDRLLSNAKAVLIGIGYEFQLCGAIETEPHDCKMDYILTESELVVCG